MLADNHQTTREANPSLQPGALVRTVRCWSGGIHRALIHDVRELDGECWAFGPNDCWAFRARELEVIRPPLS